MKKKNVALNRQILSVMDNADFHIVESYKALRTNIMFSLPSVKEKTCRRIMITSSCPSEGKTTTAVNLAVTLAEAEKKVLLIDADLRKPAVYKYFDIKITCGLSNLLSGMNKKEECVHSVKGIPNLYIINSGMRPPNPSELLGSSAMRELLDIFAQEFDYIIIDTPPFKIFADALSLVRCVDGVALVVSQNKSTYPELSKTISALKFANANILGVILNKVKVSKSSKRSGAYRKYYGGNYLQNSDMYTDDSEDDE